MSQMVTASNGAESMRSPAVAELNELQREVPAPLVSPVDSSFMTGESSRLMTSRIRLPRLKEKLAWTTFARNHAWLKLRHCRAFRRRQEHFGGRRRRPVTADIGADAAGWRGAKS